jgi:hypothetical protein
MQKKHEQSVILLEHSHIKLARLLARLWVSLQAWLTDHNMQQPKHIIHCCTEALPLPHNPHRQQQQQQQQRLTPRT